MSLYGQEFLNDAKEITFDLGIPCATAGSTVTFSALISEPAYTTVLESGGYNERTQYTVRLPAATASWAKPDGSIGASAAVIASGVPIPALGIGKKLTVGGKVVRITSQTYKTLSAWITLVVVDDNQ
jgi:hypothetical protein